ncbi:MAG: signal peptidase I [Parcubacteria group bacterium SW_6_46_9]|nr:MAG: signal peptidase I [Parcubacteria group bacterium SW_6_46_9]
MSVLGTLLPLAITIAVIAGLWRVFTKAGEQGWKVLIPIYNAYIILQIVGRPGWWLVLYLIPLVNVIVVIVVNNDLSKSFGKGTGFTIGLLFLPFIFAPILGFGDAQYVGPAAQEDFGTRSANGPNQQPPQPER